MIAWIVENKIVIGFWSYFFFGCFIVEKTLGEDFEYMGPVTRSRSIGLLAFIWPLVLAYMAVLILWDWYRDRE